ncbi:MAG: D-tyrosyl-tRNA(Tyr) deacylase [Leptospiraceae bacterium]|nr:D-tyrosyl-tRNA(Tyr) deacylase [Leptospiraceae bacterium]
MKAVIQRVKKGSVKIEKENYFKEIGKGLVVLVGIHKKNKKKELDTIVKKISNMRIFEDENRKMNLSIKDINGELLLISQFTLIADTKKGNRPGFSESKKFEEASIIYEELANLFQIELGENYVQTGIFGADMMVDILNEGPVTIILDTKEYE